MNLGILVGGGPAPGINGVIAAAAREAIKCGLRVVGIYDGYRDLAAGTPVLTREIDDDDIARIRYSGGSLLRTSRTNPAKDAASLERCIAGIRALDLRYLVCIGGDDTTYGATKIAEAAGSTLGIATVPKTIDNDLPLPDNAPTFGFETARSVGTEIVESLIEDAMTTSRWYLVVSMGRKSGALALGMCKAAGATLAVIPEEFPPNADVGLAIDTIVGSIVKQRALGRLDGVAIVAEGVAERLSLESLSSLDGVERDAFGHVRLADIPIGPVLRDGVRKRLTELGVDTTVTAKDVGYELRCAKPVPFDLDYTRTLGYGAVRYLLDGGSGALIALRGGRVEPMRLEELIDPQTGRIRTRLVDVTTEAYRVARDNMVRLEAEDLDSPQVERIAAQTTLDPQTFRLQFEAAVRVSPTTPV
ncbi:MAG TPA: 6-phosphofructokinase [Candidatus Tumulicola sp.]|jgi:6-phosphofructokinase 1